MTLDDVADQLDDNELAIEPRSLALIAYYDGWGQAVGMPALAYPRRITRAEAVHWQDGWNEGQAHQRMWASAADATHRTEPATTPPPDGFVEATRPHGRTRWACVICGVTGLPGGRWMETHQRTHHQCQACHRWLTSKLDGTPRAHTRCPEKGSTWSTSPRPT